MHGKNCNAITAKVLVSLSLIRPLKVSSEWCKDGADNSFALCVMLI